MEFVSEEELEILSKDSGIEILDAIKKIPFKEKSWIPDDCGVYILTRTDKEQYVGSSYSIIIRTKYHHIENIETIDIYLTNEDEYLKLEQWFIHQIKPSLNVVFYINKPKTKSVLIDNDVHRNLLNIQRLIYEKRKYSISLGDIINRLLDKNPEDIANQIIKTIKYVGYTYG